MTVLEVENIPGHREGRLRLMKAVLFAMQLLVATRSLLGESKFDAANQLLQEVLHERRRANDQASRQKVANDIQSFLPHEEELLNEGILDELNRADSTTPQRLAKQLTRVLGDSGDPQAETAVVLTFGNPERPFYLVAYTIGWCAICSRSWLGVFGPETSKGYKLLARMEDPFPDRPLAFLKISSPKTEETLFLFHSVGYGDPHHRLGVILYSFEGHELKTKWSRLDLPDGEVKLADRTIVLSFHTAVDTPGQPPSKERTEVYRLTPEGMKLERAFEKGLS